MRTLLKLTLVTLLLALTLTLSAQQEKGPWRAANTTARSITGDIVLSSDKSTDKLTINFLAFTIARIRPLTPAEIAAAFNPDPTTQNSAAPTSASLYRLDIPATQKFLRKNTLCGSDDTTWMATYVSGRSLQIAFFSDQKPPTLTREALADSTTLCGTYAYIR